MTDFDEIIERRNTNSIKYEFKKPTDNKRFYPMWIADMDFACPDAVLTAIKERVDKKILGYSGVFDEDYFLAVKGWMKSRHGLDVCNEQIVTSGGVVIAMNRAVEQLTEKGDSVLIFTPSYNPFYEAIRSQGRNAVFSRLLYDEENATYKIDFDDFAEKIKSVKLFFLCSPHNPVGRVWSEDELARLCKLCVDNDVFIFSDEIHFDLTRIGQKHVSTRSLIPDYKKLITATSPSKTFNLAGMSLSNILFSDVALAQDWRERRFLGASNPLSIEACKAAYTYCADWVDELRAYLDGNFDFMQSYLLHNLPQAKLTKSEGLFLAWLNLNAFDLSETELKTRFEAHGLFLEYASDFVDNADGFVRINFAMPKQRLKEALEQLCLALK